MDEPASALDPMAEHEVYQKFTEMSEGKRQSWFRTGFTAPDLMVHQIWGGDVDMTEKSLVLAVDMYGCPNRCRHCWLGHKPNLRMEDGDDVWIVDYFKPFFQQIAYYSWLREPDFCNDYRERWKRDNDISVNAKPQRYELASFWRLVRDPDYVLFLKETGVKIVQLTFFGMEEMTDKYVGRKGAFQELLKATDILIANQIAPRWQVFINEENKDQMTQLVDLAKSLRLEERCMTFGEKFKFFVHDGSCEGENTKLYDIRIEKDHIPEAIKPYYLNYDKIYTERECCRLLKEDESHIVYHNEEEITLFLSNTFDVYFNFTHMAEEWKIGNLKNTAPEEMARRIIEEDINALNAAKSVTVKTLVERYGNADSNRVFTINDYKSYLLNCYVGSVSAGQQKSDKHTTLNPYYSHSISRYMIEIRSLKAHKYCEFSSKPVAFI